MSAGTGAPGRIALRALLPGGVAAEIAWETRARLVTPFLIGGPLEPAGLVQGVFGLSSRTLAEAIHLATGFVGYPLGYALLARPVLRAVLPRAGAVGHALLFGLALWVFALYVLAHLVVGMPAFLGFGALARASLAGHLLYALALMLAHERLIAPGHPPAATPSHPKEGDPTWSR